MTARLNQLERKVAALEERLRMTEAALTLVWMSLSAVQSGPAPERPMLNAAIDAVTAGTHVRIVPVKSGDDVIPVPEVRDEDSPYVGDALLRRYASNP
jgi:hypothetical protein